MADIEANVLVSSDLRIPSNTFTRQSGSDLANNADARLFETMTKSTNFNQINTTEKAKSISSKVLPAEFRAVSRIERNCVTVGTQCSFVW